MAVIEESVESVKDMKSLEEQVGSRKDIDAIDSEKNSV